MYSEYVSIFKIDGVPILPPVMTKDRREEMRLLRDLAVKVDQRINERRRKEIIKPDQVDAVSPEPAAQDFDETATSETLPTDVVVSYPPQTELPATPVTPPPPLNNSPVSLSTPSPSPSPQKTPANTLLVTGESPKLIRSNSYTLDQPSPLLLKFLDLSNNQNLQKKKLKKKATTHNKSACSTPKTPSPGNRKKTPRKLSDPTKLRSIYGIKAPSPVRKSKSETLDDTKRRLTIHSRGEKVEKFFMKSKTVKDFENLTQKRPQELQVDDKENANSQQSPVIITTDHCEVSDESTIKEAFVPVTDEKAKANELNLQIKRDEEPEIVHQMDELNLVDRTSTPLQRMTSSVEDSSQSEAEGQFNETSFYSTIRGESPVCSMSLVSDAYSKQYLHSIRSFTTSPLSLSVTVRQQENEEIAATIINSYVRGYLVRRLLRTEFVLSIIDNIKKILFLILDSNPRDIQLKRTYLMQLNGNCEKLHDVFFQYSTKERMEIIHKDREQLLQRLSQRRKRQLTHSGIIHIHK